MKTIPNDPTLSGSIVLVRGKSFLSKQIMMHMYLYAKMTGRVPLRYSHAETLFWNSAGNIMQTIGARDTGTESNWVESYYKDKEFIILKPKVNLTESENFNILFYYIKVDKSKYQTGNFLSWITYLKTGFWFSAKGAKRNYCYELAARFSDAIGRWPKGKSLDMVSIYDLYENENYEIYQP